MKKYIDLIKELQRENDYLKSLLIDAGINFNSKPAEEETVLDPNQGERIIFEAITHEHPSKFYSYFWGRVDVYSRRSTNKAYYPKCANFYKPDICYRRTNSEIKCRDCEHRQWEELGPLQIRNHLEGKEVIGIYPLFPDGKCRFLVFDFDNHEKGAAAEDFANIDQSWMEEVNALVQIGKNYGVPMLTERSRSGRGAHVWIFFAVPIYASLARKFGFAMLEKGADSVNLTSFRFYDRMLPAQDYLEEGELGNLIALPLQKEALEKGNSAFVDENWNAYPDQWGRLLSSPKMQLSRVEELVAKWTGNSQSDEKPWERKKQFHKEDVDGTMSMVLSRLIYVQKANLAPRILNQIRRMAAFSNPEFFSKRGMHLSTFSIPRYIYLGEDEYGYLSIPRGLLEQIQKLCDDARIPYKVIDQRCFGKQIDISFVGALRENQKKAVDTITQFNSGILSAATAFGKTVVACNIIAKKRVNTLILLESSSLVEQWEEALKKYLRIDEELPNYTTKTGVVKQRSSVIGIIHGAKDTSTGIIDIAMVGSLYKKGDLHPRLKEYGMVLIDECHHCASDIFTRILREVEAAYVYGFSATTFRADGLEKINEMYLGPVRFEYSAKERAIEQGIDHFVVPRFTRTIYPHGTEHVHISEAYNAVRNDELRNAQIADDIKACIAKNRTPIVLTKFTDHAQALYDMLKNSADYVFLLVGSMSKLEQKHIRQQMDAVTSDKTMILVATGQLVGEGFDYPRLDTLIMADPVAWKGVVEQYAGRLNRDYEGKKNVIIYDYIDANIPVFDSMYSKRLRAYKRIGYQLLDGVDTEKQAVNAIYDSDSYGPVYEKDLKESKSDIVISSPTLGIRKVETLLRIIREHQDAKLKVTVVTWHPDSYIYGTDEHRIALMEKLRNCGVNIQLVKDNCDHFAVIDKEIVWYGSMNLLSKDDVEDNIMRVVSKSIAAELLEMTFKKGNQLLEYSLPLL